ncbi:MAG: diguanylate cyclase [Gammaproteobacteria bacterium]|nr:diguanylate cyclase [Gammaproteobacteria bacterium]
MKVLLAEDSRSNQMLIKACIEDAGHEVVTANNGQEAIDAFIDDRPDLVLLDVVMPVKDGIETAREIKQLTEQDNDWIPIVFLSAMADAKDIEKAIDAGGDDYLVKPIDAIVLNAKLRAMKRIAKMRHQLHKANLELKLMASRDGLTGLANRRHFDEMLIKELKRSARLKTPLSLILCDIDFFKLFNDNYGHQGGDDCLKAVAKKMQETVKRPGDVLARYGGEEFAVILPETDLAGATHIAKQLKAAIEQLAMPHAYSSVADYVTLSLGVACVDTVDTNFIEIIRTLIERADKGLYQAKTQGRNQVVCFDDEI